MKEKERKKEIIKYFKSLQPGIGSERIETEYLNLLYQVDRNILRFDYDYDYDEKTLEATVIGIVERTINYPIYDYILNIGEIPTKLLAKKIGMIIPPDQDAKKYYYDNILFYSGVLNRSPGDLNVKYLQFSKLYLLSDEEIFNLFGIYIYYDSRRNLISNFTAFRDSTSNQFFIPLISTTYFCLHTCLYNQDAEQSKENLMMGYGDSDNNNCILLSNLANSFKKQNYPYPLWIKSNIKSNIKSDIRIEIDLKTKYSLIHLLDIYSKNYPRTTELANKLKEKYADIL